MTANESVNTILRCPHGEITQKLIVARTAPETEGLAALNMIATVKGPTPNEFYTNKGTTRDEVAGIDLVAHPVDYASTLKWMVDEGVEEIYEAMTLYDVLPDDAPEKAEYLAAITRWSEIHGKAPELVTFTTRIKASRAIKTTMGRTGARVTIPTSDLTGLGLDPADLIALQQALDEVNGQDAYDVELAAIRRAKPSEYLVISEELAARAKAITADQVGTFCLPLSHADKVLHLALNIRALGNTPGNWKIAAVRLFLIEHGYLRLADRGAQYHVTHDEVRITASRPTAAQLTEAAKWFISAEAKNFLIKAKVLGLVAPIMASDVFLRTGHHYITGATYDENYNRLFDAATLAELKGIMAYEDLFHVAIHWIGPYTMRLAWSNLKDTTSIPNTFNTRFDAAPAGSALVTTTKAVLDALSTLGCFESVRELYGDSIDAVRTLEPVIKKSSTRYFDLSYLFGQEPLSAAEKTTLEVTKQHAVRLAPICKAFLSTVGRDTNMSKARVLDKHAEQNQGVRSIAEKWFKNYMTKAANVESLKAALGAK